MTRMKFYGCVSCLLGVISFEAFAWAQQGTKPVGEPRLPPGAFGGVPSTQTFTFTADPTNGGPGFAAPPADPFGGPSGTMGLTFGGIGAIRGGGRSEGPVRVKIVARTVHESIYEPVPPEELAQFQAFQEAMQALKDAKDDGAKKKASDAIRLELQRQWERDTVQREQELATVEERVKSLREQLDKRKAKWEDIISLRLKTIINNAEGLGFPGDDGQPGGTSVTPQPALGFPLGFPGAAAGAEPGAAEGAEWNPRTIIRREVPAGGSPKR